MKKHLLILLCIVLSELTAQAQQNVFSGIIYSSTNNVYSGSVVQTYDYGFMMVGENDIIKIDSASNFLWANTTNVQFGNIIATNDSNYLIVGVGVDSTGGSGCAVIKVNANGDIKWKSAFGSLVSGVSTVQQTIDSGYIITGSYTIPNNIPTAFIAKINATGQLQWEESITVGSYSYNFASSAVIQTPDTGYAITGYILDSKTHASACLVKLNANGNVLWSNKYTSNNGNKYLYGNNLVATKKGLLCLIDGEGLLQTDFKGNILWFKGNGVSKATYTTNIVKMRNSNYAFAGGSQYGGSGSIEEVDSAGNVVFSRSTNFLNMINLTQTKDGGLLIIDDGPLLTARYEDAGDNPQVGIIKTDSLGNAWACIMPVISLPEKDSIINSPIVITGEIISETNYPLYYTSDTLILSLDYDCIAFHGDGIQDNEAQNSTTLYPNPATDNVNITLPTQAAFAVYNIMGQLVYSESAKNRSGDMQLLVTTYPNGLYFIKTQIATGTQTVKLVVQH